MRLMLGIPALLFLLGCDPVHNRLDRRILDCGEGVRGDAGLWIKVLDPKGNELPLSEQLDARSLRLNATGKLPPELAVSQKHCVKADPNEALVIRSRANDRSWSAFVTRDALSRIETVRLQDSSQQTARLRCPSPWISNGLLRVPLELNAGIQTDALALAPSLMGPGGLLWAGGFGLQKDTDIIAWPRDWPDGPGRLILVQKNFLQNDSSALAQKEESCDVIIDREAPQLLVSPVPNPGGSLEVTPGALVNLRMNDAHPLAVDWCLREVNAPNCEPQTGGTEVSLTAPARGRWTLEARARDAAGNQSALYQQSIAVIQSDVVHAIESRVDQAVAEQSGQAFQSGLSILRALVDYKRLVLPEEQDQVKRKIIDGILEVAPSIQERQRLLLPGSARRVWAVNAKPDTPWLSLTTRELSLWTHEGRLLDQFATKDSLAAEWSASQQAMALGDSTRLQVIRIVGDKFGEPLSLDWEEIGTDGSPHDIKWLEPSSQLVVALSGAEPVVLDAAPDGLTFQTRLDLNNSQLLAVSKDRQWIAATSYDQVSLYEKINNKWEKRGTKELGVKDLQFSSASDTIEARLIILHSDGSVTSWSPEEGWKTLDANKQEEQPTEVKIGRDIAHLQSWADGRSGLFERGGRFYQWNSDATKALLPIQVPGFNWNELRLWKLDACRNGIWLQDDKNLSYWQIVNEAEPSLVLRGTWFVAPDRPYDFVSNCALDQRDFVTLDEIQSRLRFWSQHGPLPVFEADPTDTVFLRFMPNFADGERLVAGGFDGILRFFDQAGNLLTQWIGHTRQVSDLLFVPESQQFLSTAEDGSTRIWNANGTLAAPPLELGPTARVREGSAFIDRDHIVSTGSKLLAFWEQQNGIWTQLTTIPLSSGERSYEDGLRVLTEGGEPRVLVRLVARSQWRVLVLNARGRPVTEPGLPVLQGLKSVVWTPDGKTLAIIDAASLLRIYSLTNGFWQEFPVMQIAGSLTDLSLAPDAQGLVGLRDGRQLQLWNLKAGQWVLGPAANLNSSLSLQKGLVWSRDSKKIILSQGGRIFIMNEQLQTQHRFQAFPGQTNMSSLVTAPDPDHLAISAKYQVRIIDLDLGRLQNKFCGWLKVYLESDDDLVGDMESLRALCAVVH